MKNEEERNKHTPGQRIKAMALAISLVVLAQLFVFSGELVWIVVLLAILLWFVVMVIRSLYHFFLLQYDDGDEKGGSDDEIRSTTIVK